MKTIKFFLFVACFFTLQSFTTHVSTGHQFSCAVNDSNQVQCWGHNSFGQLGYGDTNYRGDNLGDMGNNLPYVDLGYNLPIVKIASGNEHTCVVFSDSKVKCWGANTFGQLGLGDSNNRGDNPGEMGTNLPFVNLGMPIGVSIKGIDLGQSFSCVLFSDWKVKCWGYNNFGTLGLEDNQIHRGDNPGEMGVNLPYVNLDMQVGQISSGRYRSCAVDRSGDRVKCWGHNSNGQLGLGDFNHRGDVPGEMGINLPFVNLDMIKIIKISVGQHSQCALSGANSRIKCWGTNQEGQLGYGDTDIRGDSLADMGTNLPYVDLNGLAKDVTVGYLSSCAKVGTDFKCWGHNSYGQAGQGDTNDRGDTPGEMGANLSLINLGNTVNVSGNIHPYTPDKIFLYGSFPCALSFEGHLKCWGHNLVGQLGIENTANQGDIPSEMGNNLLGVMLP